jgi:group II intron reverse transcriptase/maturase
MGNMEDALTSKTVYTKQTRIAELARKLPGRTIWSLNHYLDLDWMREACRRIRKDAAEGVDGMNWEEYSRDLDTRLRDLLNRAKAGDRYRAPAVRRVYIPKGKHEKRPLGIPTLEDKILQRAVVMVMEPIYEQEFLDCSKGFRPGCSQHQALDLIWQQIMQTGGCWLIDADISKFFDTLDKAVLRKFVRQRVGDGVIRRLIGKWLSAGVLDEGVVHYPETGTPQGGVISPMLSNIYLHHVVDLWFEDQIKPRLKGRAWMVRFADDFVMGFEHEQDARRVYEVLFKRFKKHGLRIHPQKTRLVSFYPPESNGGKRETFDFLGFTHSWGKSRKGRAIVKRQTMSKRLTRALERVRKYCRANRNEALETQWKALKQKMRGHYGYYGITGNMRQLANYAYESERIWRYWLNRRSRQRDMPWKRFVRILVRYPLPRPRIVHSCLRAKNSV